VRGRVNCRLGAGGAKENTAFQFDRFSVPTFVRVLQCVAVKRDISPGGLNRKFQVSSFKVFYFVKFSTH
jgi:hypothetical protein